MSEKISTSVNSSHLGDILERVLDKGIVIAGDIKVQIADIDLLTIKMRFIIASVDRAKEIGLNWWQDDSFLSSSARENELRRENHQLLERLEKLQATQTSST
jgi:hypothetical protein